MRMVDLIELKKQHKELNKEQLHFIIKGYVNGDIPDYQMSALMMAICFTGLSKKELAALTIEMLNSGEVIDLSNIEGIKVDKHSTGGVGDKVSLVLGPMVAACGVKVAKMSGRGLGHTGGTLDKLESIPGFRIQIEKENFIKQVNDIGIAIIGQTESLVPADKKMYALRDVTATVSCIPLIASSIMSKKLASGSDAILFDVKYGEGAFMKTKEEAIELARTMIDIGVELGKSTRATISNMNQPLGNAIGNMLEVKESIETLQGKGPEDVFALCLEAGSHLLVQAKRAENINQARDMLQEVVDNGRALEKFRELVEAQHGDGSYIMNPDAFKQAEHVIPIKSVNTGYIETMQADAIGIVSMKLGGGRQTKDDVIDYSVGIMLTKKIGDFVKEGEPIAFVHANSEVTQVLIDELLSAYTIIDSKVERPILIEEVLL